MMGIEVNDKTRSPRATSAAAVTARLLKRQNPIDVWPVGTMARRAQRQKGRATFSLVEAFNRIDPRSRSELRRNKSTLLRPRCRLDGTAACFEPDARSRSICSFGVDPFEFNVCRRTRRELHKSVTELRIGRCHLALLASGRSIQDDLALVHDRRRLGGSRRARPSPKASAEKPRGASDLDILLLLFHQEGDNRSIDDAWGMQIVAISKVGSAATTHRSKDVTGPVERLATSTKIVGSGAHCLRLCICDPSRSRRRPFGVGDVRSSDVLRSQSDWVRPNGQFEIGFHCIRTRPLGTCRKVAVYPQLSRSRRSISLSQRSLRNELPLATTSSLALDPSIKYVGGVISIALHVRVTSSSSTTSTAPATTANPPPLNLDCTGNCAGVYPVVAAVINKQSGKTVSAITTQLCYVANQGGTFRSMSPSFFRSERPSHFRRLVHQRLQNPKSRQSS